MMRTPRPSRQSSQERQASLIQAATTLFARKGFNGTTTKEIARAAGVSEALVFKHFPTKRALYAAILAEKVTVSELLGAIEESAKKRDDRRGFTLIASYRIRPGVDPTLLRLLLGYIRPTSGSASVAGCDCASKMRQPSTRPCAKGARSS